jgi:hypothetical protein
MLAIIAAILFAIAFILRAAGIATDAIFAPISLLLLGLICLALHLAGVGTGAHHNGPAAIRRPARCDAQAESALPAVPAAAGWPCDGLADAQDKAEQENDQRHQRDPPQHVDRKAKTPENQDNQQREKDDRHLTSSPLTTSLGYPADAL